VDVWAEYARLSDEEGWTQEKIADAKGVSRPMVSFRVKLHQLSDEIKSYVTQGLLTETHMRRISELLLELHFSPWLTSDQAMLELAEKAVYDKKKNGDKSVRVLDADAFQTNHQESPGAVWPPSIPFLRL